MRRPPSQLVLALIAYGVVAALAATWLALLPPWLGLDLRPSADGRVEVAAAHGPSASVPAGAILEAVRPGSGGARVALRAGDLAEEPDLLGDYAQLDAFFRRQGEIHEAVAASSTVLEVRGVDGVDEIGVRAAQRPLGSLPPMFWFQLAVSSLGCLIAGTVVALRPGDWGARMFAITGLAFPVFAMSAAVYSSRELALPASTFGALSAVNHLGAAAFGAAFVALLLVHPKRLVRPAHAAWPFVLSGLWWLVDELRLAPDLDWGLRYAAMVQLAAAAALAALQWRRSARQPVERASLRWLVSSMLAGGGLFVLTIVATTSLGWAPPLPQGYAFGFLLVVYFGVALGLRRYRLFDLDPWALRMLTWVCGALAVVMLDTVLVLALGWSAGAALGASLWASALAYFPLRQWLWDRIVGTHRIQSHEVVPDIVRIAFQPAGAARTRMWDELLRRLFDPLEIEELEDGDGATMARVREHGLALAVPAPCEALAGRRLRYPERGRRLFLPRDERFVEGLRRLLASADDSRRAYDRGAREERRRITRDLHDDVGARLLMLIHRAPTPEFADLARAAMSDLRTALNVLEGHPVSLAESIADWRAEAAGRCDAAGVALDWSAALPARDRSLGNREKTVLERALREALSNSLKHSAPAHVRVRIALDGGAVSIEVADDGKPAQPQAWIEGRGLRGMRQRLAEHGGSLALAASGEGAASVTITLPLKEGGNP